MRIICFVDGFENTRSILIGKNVDFKHCSRPSKPPLGQNHAIIGNRDYVPRQDNGFDCGVFTCVFADRLSLDRPLSFDQHYVTQCRDPIALSILNGAAM